MSVAAKRFLRDLDRGYKRQPAAVARLLAREADRGDVLKILRLNEYSLSNRRPLFLHDAPFDTPAPYYKALAERAVADYALVRKGLAEEGLSLAPLDLPPRAPSISPESHAVAILSAVAERLTPHLEGAFAVLAPATLSDPAEWRKSIDRLARTPHAESLRIAVLDLAASAASGLPAPAAAAASPRPLTTEDGHLASVLGPESASFAYDTDALFDYAEQQISRQSKGPERPPPPAVPPDVRAALEQAGTPIPDPRVATALHTHFLQAARAAAKNDFKSAAESYRRARDLARDERLGIQEAAATFALAGAYLSTGARPMAQATYGQAALLAAEQRHWPMSAQAKLGEAGVAFMDRDWHRAARAYSEAANLAERGALPPLQIEALRMEGLAHEQRGHEADAITAWRRAIETAKDDEPARRTSTFPQVVNALATLLEKRGLHAQAAHLRTLLDGPEGARQ